MARRSTTDVVCLAVQIFFAFFVLAFVVFSIFWSNRKCCRVSDPGFWLFVADTQKYRSSVASQSGLGS